jgi:ABC-type nickel/cobalt efflux system permease component RcnA
MDPEHISAIVSLLILILSSAWTIFQEWRHYKNHGTISPKAQQLRDIAIHQIEQQILDFLNDKKILDTHQIKLEIKQK